MKDIQIKNIIKDKDEIIKSKDDIIFEKNIEIDLLNKKKYPKVNIPQYVKPNLNTNLKISAPTGKELTLEQLKQLSFYDFERN